MPSLRRIRSLSLLGLLCWASGVLRGAVADEVKTFSCELGDTLILQNDYGRIRVRGWDSSQLEARIQRNVVGSSREEQVQVTSRKNRNKIFIYSFFAGTPGESVHVDIRAPRFMNVVIWGANPEVELYGIQGYVRAQTLTGSITAENLTHSVSLISDQGNLTYRSSAQPSGDSRLESSAGTIRCELDRNLNLRAWIRAGGKLLWDQEAEPAGTAIERQLGINGPLLYASSLQGAVDVRLTGSGGSPINATSNPARVNGAVAGSQLPASPQARIGTRPGSGSGPPVLVSKEREESRGEAPIHAPPEPGAGGSPTSAPSPASASVTFKVDVKSVTLNVSVRDRYTNRSLAGLQKKDFLVYEDGVLQEVDQLLPVEEPFSLLLLLDVSGSTSSYIDLIKDASIEFTREIKSNDRIAVAIFNSRVHLVRDFTSDRQEAARSIEQIRSGGGTAFYDALEASIDEYMRGIDGRKAIVVFTDGIDNRLSGDAAAGSRTTFEQLFRKIQEIDSIIYTIFLDTEGSHAGSRRRQPGIADILGGIIRGKPPVTVPRRPDHAAAYEQAREQVQRIADQTGGRMYAPRRIEDLDEAYSEIAADLRIQYHLAYYPSNRELETSWRSIKIHIKDMPNAVARTRKGYYAGKPARMTIDE